MATPARIDSTEPRSKPGGVCYWDTGGQHPELVPGDPRRSERRNVFPEHAGGSQPLRGFRRMAANVVGLLEPARIRDTGDGFFRLPVRHAKRLLSEDEESCGDQRPVSWSVSDSVGVVRSGAARRGSAVSAPAEVR